MTVCHSKSIMNFANDSISIYFLNYTFFKKYCYLYKSFFIQGLNMFTVFHLCSHQLGKCMHKLNRTF